MKMFAMASSASASRKPKAAAGVASSSNSTASSSAAAQTALASAVNVAELDRLRAQIDAINVKLVRLLNQRAKVAQAIGHLKQAAGAAIYQPARERAVLDRVTALNQGPLAGEHLQRIFAEIISACTALERPQRVAFLGPAHTYSHEAARMRLGSSAEF